MEINLLLIILVVVAVWRMWMGFRNGLIDEMNRVISLAAALFVLALAVMIIYGFMEENTKNIITAVIALVVTGLAFRLINIVIKSLKALVKLPIINLLNGILGAAAGFAEIILLCWIMYTVIQLLPDNKVGEQIMIWTNENQYLMTLYSFLN
jgi:uncharacterized membrane protein required for colicin V production